MTDGRSRSQELDDLEVRPGYALKRASVALHRAMEDAVRPHGLTVAQYACLEVLARNPGASPADLARGAFVTRQAAHQVLQRLVAAGLVERSDHPTLGHRRQVHLTAVGRRRRREAAGSVRDVEARLAAALPEGDAPDFAARLRAVADELGAPPGRASGSVDVD